MNRNGAALAAGALIGAAAALLYRRRPQLSTADPRAEELRQKLAEARASRADEDDFEAMRRRIHEEGKAAAEEMRGDGG